MERIRYNIMFFLAIVGIFAVGGCQPYAQKKQEMVQEWESSTARAKVPVAEGLLKQGKIDQARSMLLQCLKKNPDLPRAHFLMGRICLAESQIPQGRLYFLQAVELDDRMDEAWYALGILEQNEGKFQQAETFVNTAFTLQPAEIQYILSLADIYQSQGQTEKARQFIDQQRKNLPGRPELLVRAAQLEQASGNEPEAIQLYRQALLQNEEDPYLLETLGVCYMNQQQWLPATETFEKLLRVVPQEGKETVLSWLAQCAFNAGQYGRALDGYDKLSVYRREDPQIWLAMGQAALGADLPDRACQCGEKALQLQPDLMEARVIIGCSLYMKKNYPGALPFFEKACRDTRWEAFSWLMAGRCYQQLGQNSLARSAFEKASQLRSETSMMNMLMEDNGDMLKTL